MPLLNYNLLSKKQEVSKLLTQYVDAKILQVTSV